MPASDLSVCDEVYSSFRLLPGGFLKGSTEGYTWGYKCPDPSPNPKPYTLYPEPGLWSSLERLRAEGFRIFFFFLGGGLGVQA